MKISSVLIICAVFCLNSFAKSPCKFLKDFEGSYTKTYDFDDETTEQITIKLIAEDEKTASVEIDDNGEPVDAVPEYFVKSETNDGKYGSGEPYKSEYYYSAEPFDSICLLTEFHPVKPSDYYYDYYPELYQYSIRKLKKGVYQLIEIDGGNAILTKKLTFILIK